MTQLILKCEKFGLSRGLQDLLGAGELVDVTLACQGHYVQAHKTVLAACSPHFRDIFKMNTWQHHTVYMQDAELSKLQALVDFMYNGEVAVTEADLPGFLKLADALKVHGLTPLDKEQQSKVSSNEQQQVPANKTSSSPPAKKAKRSRDRVVSKREVAPEAALINVESTSQQQQQSWPAEAARVGTQMMQPSDIKLEAYEATYNLAEDHNIADCEVDNSHIDVEATQGAGCWYEAGPSGSAQASSSSHLMTQASVTGVSSRGRKLRKVERLLEAYDILQSPDSPDDSSFLTCKFCDKKFKTRLNFRKHLKNKHENEQHRLSLGSRTLTLDVSLDTTCDVCYDEFEDHAQLMEHKKNKHLFELDNGQFVDLATQVKTENNQYQCDICFKSYVSNFSLQRHKKCHPMPTTMSDIKITDLRTLKIESDDSETEAEATDLILSAPIVEDEGVKVEKVKAECKLEQQACEICTRVFTRKQYLLVHYKFKHPEKLTPSDFPFACNFCAKKFATFRTLKVHLRKIHDSTADISVKCRVCTEEFKSNESLAKHHLSVHAVQTRFQCLFCPKNYLHKPDVSRHMKNQHNMNVQKTRV